MIWTWIIRVILRHRFAVLAVIALITAYFGYKAVSIQMTYEMTNLLPENNETYQNYKRFKKQFGEDGRIIALGVRNPEIFQLEEFNRWYDLGNEIGKLKGVQEVVSISRVVVIEKDTTIRKFTFRPLVNRRPETQAEVDSIKAKLHNLPFYKGLFYNPVSHDYLMAITLSENEINSKSRIKIVEGIQNLVNNYEKESSRKVYRSGMPYIRTITMKLIKDELFLFLALSLLIAAVIMYLFFRSFRVVLASLVLVIISIIWVMGFISMLGYKITILNGVIPSLIVIIAIENCIYILNKYHVEYINHGNKIRALSRTIRRIGFASLMTNTATALGFAAFILVNNKMFSEFGIVTSINIMLEYVLTITLFPIFISFMNPPKERHTKHLDSKFFNRITEFIIRIITHHRPKIYYTTAAIVLVSIFGLTKIKTSGKIVDDLNKEDPINVDLRYFESNFGGVMPFEITVDTRKPNGVLQLSTLRKINELQDSIDVHPEFSKPISLAEMVKFTRQAFYAGDETQYKLPGEMEKNFILTYLPQNKGPNPLRPYIDSTLQITRITYQVVDMGTNQMEAILEKVKPKIDSVFNPDKFDVTLTGSSIVYAKGTKFLIRNLFESVAVAIVLISLLMAIMFRSVRMIVVSMVPNLIPLLVTGAIMGFSGIPLKPSTLIVFSIALGISVDNAIQYLARYRHDLKTSNMNIGLSTVNALREASFSMIYTSIVLVLGFIVFTVSDFGGTKALGILISTTLFVAMFFNMVVLPSLLMTLDKYVVTKAFTEDAIIEVFDEKEGEPE